MKKNPPWSALIIGIFVTTLMVIIALYLLEKIVPFSHDIKGVENGNISYYRANTALNEALFSLSGSNPGYETGSSSLANGSGSSYQVISMGKTLPQPWQWNSEYAKDWWVLAPGKPIQLVLKTASAINWTSGTYFNFRVPDLNKNNDWTDQTLSGGTTRPIINWILSASGESLLASGSHIMANTASSGSVYFGNLAWLTLSGNTFTFQNFYTNNCQPSPKICTLKLSLVNPLILQDGSTAAPYLEYQAYSDVAIPLQTAVIETQGYMWGFRKNITRFVQQITTSEALDFTVFQ